MRNTFFDIGKAEFHNKAITIKCIVSGKSLSPYCIPKKIKVTHQSGESIVSIDANNENILKFLDIASTRIAGVIKQIWGFQKFTYEVIDVQNIERIFILPNTGKERNKLGSTYVAYFIGYGLEINTVYDLSGYATIDPNSQMTTYVFTSASKIKSDIDTFALTKGINDSLSQFKLPHKKENQDNIFDHLSNIYEYYAHNVTKIYDRFDLHLAIDLAFRTPITFKLRNELVKKGWSDVMIIGDTRCGKGYVAESLVKYFGLGEVISGENSTIAGLVGGLQQYNKHWVVTWGKIPLNDCGLVVIDEASEIQDNEWSKLSRVRSEGVAEITKIHTQVTNARTRLIFLTNPIQKTISNYSYGIQAMLEVIKSPEDIARFDYALVVAHNEVKVADINRERRLVQSMYPAKSEQDLILWIWSRKLNEIAFEDDAIDLIYAQSINLAKKYSFGIPLIQGENVRIKLAKIAIAFAGRLYSNKENGKILFVKKCYVDCAFAFLNLIYKKDSCGYYQWSKLQKKVDVDATVDFLQIETYFNSFRNKEHVCLCILKNNDLTLDVLSEHLNQPKEIAREIISKLVQNDCVLKKNNKYYKTPAFTAWLKKIIL